MSKVGIADLSDALGICIDDIITTLQDLNMLKKDDEGNYVIALDMAKTKEILQKYQAKNYPRAKATCLRWTPFVLGKRNVVND